MKKCSGVGTGTIEGQVVAQFNHPENTCTYDANLHLRTIALRYEEYHPFGTSAYRAHDSTFDASPRRYRFTGMERDEETGLSYHGARYYAPWLGRWTAADPIGLGDGVNRYRYSSNNPVGFVDRTGGFGNPIAWAKQKATEIQAKVETAVYEAETEAFTQEVERQAERKETVGKQVERFESGSQPDLLDNQGATSQEYKDARAARKQAKYEKVQADIATERQENAATTLNVGTAIIVGIGVGLATAGTGLVVSGALSGGVGAASGELAEQAGYEDSIDGGKVLDAAKTGAAYGAAFGLAGKVAGAVLTKAGVTSSQAGVLDELANIADDQVAATAAGKIGPEGRANPSGSFQDVKGRFASNPNKADGPTSGSTGPKKKPGATKPRHATEDHHSDPEFMGGAKDQPLTTLETEVHQQLHRDMYYFLGNISDGAGNTMRPASNNSGANIQKNFSRDELLDALADFYKTFEDAYPTAAADFFSQHPNLNK